MDARMSQNEDLVRRVAESQTSLAGALVKISESHDRLVETHGATMNVLRSMQGTLIDHEVRLAAGKL
jgi:hypothetical protein